MKQKSTKTTVTFRLDKKLKQEIRKQARLVGRSPSAYVEQIIMERLIRVMEAQAND